MEKLISNKNQFICYDYKSELFRIIKNTTINVAGNLFIRDIKNEYFSLNLDKFPRQGENKTSILKVLDTTIITCIETSAPDLPLVIRIFSTYLNKFYKKASFQKDFTYKENDSFENQFSFFSEKENNDITDTYEK